MKPAENSSTRILHGFRFVVCVRLSRPFHHDHHSVELGYHRGVQLRSRSTRLKPRMIAVDTDTCRRTKGPCIRRGCANMYTMFVGKTVGNNF